MTTLKDVDGFIRKKYPNSCYVTNINEEYFDDYNPQDIANCAMDHFHYGILHWCGCGYPEDMEKLVYRYLSAVRTREEMRKAYGPHLALDVDRVIFGFSKTDEDDRTLNYQLYWAFMYAVDAAGFTVHGSCLSGANITDLGEAFLTVAPYVRRDGNPIVPEGEERCAADPTREYRAPGIVVNDNTIALKNIEQL